jgi:ATP-binding cassette subfamily B protein
MPTLMMLTNLGTVAIIWLGGLDVIGERLSVGELVAFNNYLMIGMTPLLLLGNVLTMVSRAEVSAARILELLNSRPMIQTIPTPHRAEVVKGQVVFENVSFHYPTRPAANGRREMDPFDDRRNGYDQVAGRTNGTDSREVLNNVSFVVESGQQVALLGATGSGKSTIINLLPRFYDPSEGRITIDDHDLRDVKLESLRSQIGIVLQETTLFSGSIRENIAFGRPEATQKEIEAAAKAAQAHDFIMSFPEGYETHVGERGQTLSGGQKQRVAIARALLLNPRILILDDSTSSVDLATESLIQAALDKLMEGRTSFVIAQRISTVMTADKILVLDRGEVVAIGKHLDLMENEPIYAEIYNSQILSYEAEHSQTSEVFATSYPKGKHPRNGVEGAKTSEVSREVQL